MRYVGVHEEPTTGGRSVERAQRAFPKTNLSRAFVNNIITSDFVRKVQAALKPHLTETDSRIYLSMKTDPRLTARGGYTRAYGNVARYLCNEGLCGRVRLIAWHEPEDNFTGKLYQKYFTQVQGSVRDACADLMVGTAANSFHWGSKWNDKNKSVKGTTDAPEEWFVPADFKGLDIYSGRSYPLATILPELEAFTRWHYHNVGDGKFAINERGWATPSKSEPEVQYELRAETIAREFEWLKNDPVGQRCTDYQYWNSSGREKDESLMLDPLGEEALSQGIALILDDTTSE